MIRRPRVFEDEHLPRDLRHREAQVSELIRALHRACTHGDQGVILTGPSGVGKTALGRVVLERYAREHGVQTAWVETMGKTTGDVFRNAITGVGGDVAHNTPNAELPRRLRDAITDDLLLLLDEGDDLAGSGTVWDLVSIPGVHAVIVVHDADDWLARADSRVRQRLHGGRIGLSRYRVTDLADILEDRARVGLVDDAVRRRQLETIADGVAGVARSGIQTLRSAAEIATERGHDRIEDGDIEDAYERARDRIRAANLSSLPYHHLVLYELVRDAGELTGEQLHDRYERVADAVYADDQTTRTPISRRDRRNKLAKLQEYDLLERERLDHRWLYTAVDSELTPDRDILSHCRVDY